MTINGYKLTDAAIRSASPSTAWESQGNDAWTVGVARTDVGDANRVPHLSQFRTPEQYLTALAEYNKQIEASPLRGVASPTWLKYHDDPTVAVLFNKPGYDRATMRLWAVEWSGTQREGRGVISGATSLKLVSELTVPTITSVQFAAFGVLAVRALLDAIGETEPWADAYRAWASGWVSGSTRARPDVLAAQNATGDAERPLWRIVYEGVNCGWAIVRLDEATAAEQPTREKVARFVGPSAAEMAAIAADRGGAPLDLPALAAAALAVT